MNSTLNLSPFNLIQNYVPREEAAQLSGLPLHIVEYWIAMRRVRITEFKKDGEGKRSIYVNMEDVNHLKEVYDLSVDMLEAENDDITYRNATIEFPQLSRDTLHYLISNCIIDCYIPDPLDWETSTMRRSDLVRACCHLEKVKHMHHHLLAKNSKALVKDVNNVLKRMIYIYCFFSEFRQFNFHPLETINFKFLTIVVNKDSRLEYHEGFNIIDLLISGEFNGIYRGAFE